mgnify:CR=1 FL=1
MSTMANFPSPICRASDMTRPMDEQDVRAAIADALADGRKLAKSEGAAALAGLRERGVDGPSLLENLRKGLLPSGISWAEPSYSVA